MGDPISFLNRRAMDEEIAKLRKEAEKVCRTSKQLIAQFRKLAERSQELGVPNTQEQPSLWIQTPTTRNRTN